MAQTPSNMLPLGTVAPEFTLPNVVDNTSFHLTKMEDAQAYLVMFICNHCPFVVHVLDEIVSLTSEYKSKGVVSVAISSNDVTNYPDDDPGKMRALARENNFSFPYLYDESQEVAKSYQAACTPDFYVFNNQMECVYRGRMDESRPKNSIPVTGKDLRNALDAVISGQTVSSEQFPSIGCNIKWKSH